METNELGIVMKSDTKLLPKWKRVPFDIELAKKIQAGEIEGRIMYFGLHGYKEIIILSYNSDKCGEDYPIRFAFVNKDEIDYLSSTESLLIELPEVLVHSDKQSEKIHTYKICYDTIRAIEEGDEVKAGSLGAFTTVRNFLANKIAKSMFV